MYKALLITLFISFKMFSQENRKMPVFPGCEENENLKKCFLTNISKHLVEGTDYLLVSEEDTEDFVENIDDTENPNELITKIVKCFFTIDYLGRTKKTRIQGNVNRDTRKKFKDNLKKLPIMKPGTLDGEAISIPFVLPVFIKQ